MPDIVKIENDNAIQTVEPEVVKRYCSYCGRELQEGAVFCPFCGKPLDGVSHQDQPSVTLVHQTNTYYQQVTTNNAAPVVEKRKVNGVGIAGFIFALLSLVVYLSSMFMTADRLFLCFILYIFGLFFSIVGMFHSPRHFAFVGLIVSIVDIFLLAFTSDEFLGTILHTFGLG